MANVDFTNSVLPTALIRLSEVFSGTDTRYFNYRNTKSELISAINKLQSAKLDMIMSGGKCKGVDVTFLKKCTTNKGFACETIATEYPSCDVPVGTSIQSDKITYDPKCLFHEAGSIDDDLCDNEFNAEELFKETIADLISRADIRLNQYAYAQIAAKAQANIDPLITDFSGVVNGTRVEIPSSQWTSDLLVQLEVNAQFNGLNNYKIFDSRNLVTQKNQSMYRSLNADEKNQVAQFNAWDSRLIFDNPLDVTTVLARASTFLIDFDMVAFVNRTSYTSQTPVLVDTTKQIYTFTVTSPRTGIKYDVDYQKVCKTTRDSLSNRHHVHALDLKFIGGLLFAPIQCDSGTGILEFTRV